MSYDGPSLPEWLAELRSRRSPTEVALYRVTLGAPTLSDVSRQTVSGLCIARFDDPDNPRPNLGFYLLSLDETGEWLADTWHESLADAFAQAEYEFGVRASDWERADV